jgi:hypothetical protein
MKTGLDAKIVLRLSPRCNLVLARFTHRPTSRSSAQSATLRQIGGAVCSCGAPSAPGETPRTLREIDYLLMFNDEARQGVLHGNPAGRSLPPMT